MKDKSKGLVSWELVDRKEFLGGRNRFESSVAIRVSYLKDPDMMLMWLKRHRQRRGETGMWEEGRGHTGPHRPRSEAHAQFTAAGLVNGNSGKGILCSGLL